MILTVFGVALFTYLNKNQSFNYKSSEAIENSSNRKNTNSDKLIEALDELQAGGAPMSINIAKMVVESFKKSPDSVLTERETQVIEMLAKGSSYKSIALKLDISINTIKYHVKNIYDKLQVHSKEDAIKEASDRNLI